MNCHPVVVAELEGRGRGLVATRQVIFRADARFSTDADFQIKKGELVLAEQPAIVVQDGGDLAASDLSIDQHFLHFGLI